MESETRVNAASIDFDRFRLRRFVERLAAEGEVRRVEKAVNLAELAGEIESTPQATWFRNVGPESLEIAAGISGSRRRIAMAFETDERNLMLTVAQRIATTQPVVEVSSADAPVHARVITGDAINLTRLPFYLQHEFDGGPYISSAIDFSIDRVTGKRNVGCRRLMLRSRTTCRTNLTNTSDLRTMYLAALQRGEPLPLSFAIGSHPADFMAGVLRAPVDEFGLLAALRGAPTPFVRGVTNDVLVPADSEIILEGYLDAQGYREMDGPYGEFWGYYGPMHPDPVFHVTAITMRSDALHQSIVHGGRESARMETNQVTAVSCELVASRTLRAAGIEPAAIYAPPGSTLFQSIRVALKRADNARARESIEHLFKIPGFKHIVVADDDVDIFDEQEVHWAASTRFRADRDLVVASGLPGFYEDPTADAGGTTAKMGVDLTAPAGWPANIKQRRTGVPVIVNSSAASLRDVLARGPKFFAELMRETGSRDGRELALALGDLCETSELTRLPDGKYALATSD
jgi:2,5-furandicarboxylate decarboxylase 1